MSERVRILEGEPVELAEDCSVCDVDVTQFYPRGNRAEDGGKQMARGNLGKILPLAPDIVGTAKTAVVAGLSMQVNERLGEMIRLRLFPAGGGGLYGEAALQAGLAILGGGLIGKFMKNRSLGIAWTLGPLTFAASSIAANLLAATPLTGMGANMPHIPPNVALPYQEDQVAAGFRSHANRMAA